MSELDPKVLMKADNLFITLLGDVFQIIKDGYGEDCADFLLQKYGFAEEPEENWKVSEEVLKEFRQLMEALFREKQ